MHKIVLIDKNSTSDEYWHTLRELDFEVLRFTNLGPAFILKSPENQSL